MVAQRPLLCTRFIGREAEVAHVAERCRAASAGSGSFVLIGGEAGIGKSRFLEIASVAFIELGASFVRAPCFAHAQAPLGPFADALGKLHRDDPGVLLEPSLGQALAPLLPELAGTAQGAALDNKRAQYGAIAEALTRFGRRQPIALAIDDAHWADLATLEFLGYLASRITEMRVLLLVAYRSEEMHSQHPLPLTLVALQRGRGTTQFKLAAFTRAEMQRLIACALEGHPNEAGARIRDVIDLAEGNPLFAEELLPHVTAPISRESRTLPLTLRAAVLRRAEELEERDRRVLAYASTLGRRFNVNLLSRLSERPETEIYRILRRSRDLQLIYEERPSSTFVFRHALIQEALHDDLLHSEARILHAQIAAEIEKTNPSDQRTFDLAYHWWAARDPEKSATYNRAAGDIAAKRLALPDAMRFYERALEFGVTNERDAAEISAKLARTTSAVEPGARARAAFETSIAYYERIGDAGAVAELWLDLGRFEWESGRQALTRVRARQALEAFPDHPIGFGVYTESACWCVLTGDVATAERYLRIAEGLPRSPKQRYVAHYHMVCARAALLRGDADTVRRQGQLGEVAARETDDFEELCTIYNNSAWHALQLGDTANAAHAIDAAASLSRARFLTDREAFALTAAAWLHFYTGNFSSARETLSMAAELVINIERPYDKILQAAVAILLGVLSSNNELVERFAVEETLEVAFASEEAALFLTCATAFVHLWATRGEHERARALLERALSKKQGLGFFPPIAIWAARFGHSDAMNGTRELLATWAQPKSNVAGKGYLDLFDALRAAREGSSAPESASAAAARFREIGYPYFEALAHESAGRFEDAQRLYHRIGAVTDEGRLEKLLKPVNRRGRAKDDLTSRERDVTVLLAQGQSNRHISEVLNLSERTVEHHVASIMRKLDVTSRAQLAAVLPKGATGSGHSVPPR